MTIDDIIDELKSLQMETEELSDKLGDLIDNILLDIEEA